jgi:hypothetical protein
MNVIRNACIETDKINKKSVATTTKKKKNCNRVMSKFKGTVSRDFRLLVFFMKQFPPKPLSIQLGPFQIFSKIRGDIRSSKCTTGVVDTGGKWKKSSIIKVLIISFEHIWEVELAYGYIFVLKFTLRSQQPDIVTIICHRFH